ncbi:MAG: putative toxin-antitoxin system toxin component, PIN family [Dysgonamonadaceae bacterium]|jgi:putative PIN family toxin of toxin-antitoxin system|nr:putative toxin-antitoxin system toxin component, PIN family [Dysgonamonadaceae bacterium]
MKNCKIIIDTNLWISLLIGKKMSEMRALCNSEIVSVYICEELMAEFVRIASCEKIRKYAPEERIRETVNLMKSSCIEVPIKNTIVSSPLRDVNDLYLLAFADTIKADYILTGDKDLLILQSHNQTKIVTYNEFVQLFS